MKKVKLKTIEKIINGICTVTVLSILIAMWTGYQEPSKLLISLLGLTFIFKSLKDFIPEIKDNKSE